MWTRAELKDRAKDVLRGRYWKSFLVSLVIVLISEGSAVTFRKDGESAYNYFNNINPAFVISVLGISVTVFAISIIVALFLFNPLEVGGRRYYVQSAQYFDNRRCFRFAFDENNYISIVGAMALKSLYLFLWTLLFIIPGIVKSYSYRMVPYILADNPNIGASRAIELSNKMTYGHKFDMFILDLSFLGWYFLGLLCFGVGTLFVKPYEHATNAELYLTLRQNAIERGDVSLWELNLYDPLGQEYNI